MFMLLLRFSALEERIIRYSCYIRRASVAERLYSKYERRGGFAKLCAWFGSSILLKGFARSKLEMLRSGNG